MASSPERAGVCKAYFSPLGLSVSSLSRLVDYLINYQRGPADGPPSEARKYRDAVVDAWGQRESVNVASVFNT